MSHENKYLLHVEYHILSRILFSQQEFISNIFLENLVKISFSCLPKVIPPWGFIHIVYVLTRKISRHLNFSFFILYHISKKFLSLWYVASLETLYSCATSHPHNFSSCMMEISHCCKKTNCVPFFLQRLSFITPLKKFLSYTTFQPNFFPLVKQHGNEDIFVPIKEKKFFTSFCMNQETFSCDMNFSPLCYVTQIVVFYMINQVVNKNNTCNIIAVTHYILLKKFSTTNFSFNFILYKIYFRYDMV